MSLKKGIALMADYVFLSKYAQKKKEERKLAEQYGMPYGEEVNDAQE